MAEVKISQEPEVPSMGSNDYFLIDTFPIQSNSTSIVTKANMLAGVSTPPSGAASGDFTGTYPGPLLANTANVQSIVNSIAGSSSNIAPNVYYVSSTGSDSANGQSWGTAFATVQKAVDTINGGATPTNNPGTVYLSDGTFPITGAAVTITRQQSIIGLGPNRTKISVNYNGIGIVYIGVYPQVTPYSTTNYPNTGLKGFTITQGVGAGNSTCGIQIADIVYPQLTDIYANGFTGSSGVAIWLQNQELPSGGSPGGFIERVKFRSLAVDNNTAGILVDRVIGANSTTGAVATVSVGSGGSGYNVSDTITIAQGANTTAVVTVSSVSGGVVTGLTVTTPGSGYFVANGLTQSSTSGGGTGATVNVLTLSGATTSYANNAYNADNSMIYHDWMDVNVNSRAVVSGGNAQTGVVFQKGVQFYHCFINIQFNITGTNGLNVVAPTAMSLVTSGAMLNCFANIRGECSSAGTATSLNMDNTGFMLATGVLDFLYSATFAASLASGSFRFAGLVNGAGLTNNSSSATNAQMTLIDHVTAGISLQIGANTLDTTHPVFQFLRATNQKLSIQAYDPTNGAIPVMDVIQGTSGNTYLGAPQGIRLNTNTRLFSGSTAPNVTNSIAGDFYFRQATGTLNYPQLLYAATAANTWTALGVYNPSTGIRDVNNSTIIGFTPVSSAVNFLNVQNNTTGNAVVIGAGGGDASVSLIFKARGTTGKTVFRPDTGGDATTAIQFNNAGSTATILDIDTTNNRIGINTATPAVPLHVVGNGQYWNTSSLAVSIDTTNARIGIGITAPTRSLDVVGIVKSQALTGSNTGLATPTAVASTGLGTSPGSIVVTGSNVAGSIAVVAGTTCAANATIMTVTFGTPNTTIAVGSNGATLPQATINVASTAGFPSFGTFTVAGDTVTYTGLTSTTFTGCTGGTATLATGNPVVSPFAYPAAPYIVLTPGNGATASIAAARIPFIPLAGATGGPTTTTFTIRSNGTEIPDGTILAWNYHVIG